MRVVGQKADIHFGEVDQDDPDWRNELEEEIDPDDEELEYTPQSVIDILGFDPKEFSEPTSNKESNVTSLNTVKAVLILNAKKGWSDAARKKAAMTRKAKGKAEMSSKQRKSMNLSSHVAHGNYTYREATNKITKSRQSMDRLIKRGKIAPEERILFDRKVTGFHKNLLRKTSQLIKKGAIAPETMKMLTKDIAAYKDDEAYSASLRKSKTRQGKRKNSGASPFGV